MERLFQIVVDSGCDMTDEYIKNNQIEQIIMGFSMDGEEFGGEDGKILDRKEFFERVAKGSMPKTYQVTSEVAKIHIEPYLKQGKDVLLVGFSSGLSGTFSCYERARDELLKDYPERKICLVDSLSGSLGEGLVLDYVVRKANEGASIEEVCEYGNKIAKSVKSIFTVDNLFHLKRGGRISSATAIVGSALKIKPIIQADKDGKLETLGKVIGRKHSLTELVKRLFGFRKSDDKRIFICHGNCEEDALFVKKLILEKLPDAEVMIEFEGTVLGSHSGPGTVALFMKCLDV